ncbi:MAG: isoaspartyl peptidase/L-asparaginase [Pseudomonadota bacterium]
MPKSADSFSMALHGGAGVTIGRDYAGVPEHLQSLAENCGERLADGLSAIDVVEYAVAEMETSGLYVAGRGSAQNAAGYVEMDASIMDGRRRKAGAVSALRDFVNPISVARSVLEDTPYILMTGAGADDFAMRCGHRQVETPNNYYVLPAGVEISDLATSGLHGTVGAVAMDRSGALAAATSTGGLFGTEAGRVGDTPLIGVGTWADERVAISCTGTGEHFILGGGAQAVATRVRSADASLDTAVDQLLADVKSAGGDGGVIAVSNEGEIVMKFNSSGMKRALVSSDRSVEVRVF